jgi:hypothetical protein
MFTHFCSVFPWDDPEERLGLIREVAVGAINSFSSPVRLKI